MDPQSRVFFSRDIRKMKEAIDRKGFSPLSDWEISQKQALCHKHFEALCLLHDLFERLQQPQSKDDKAQLMATFIGTIWENDLVFDINRFSFFEVFELGPRQYKDCFELGDISERMMYHLVLASRTNAKIRLTAHHLYGCDGWAKTEAKYLSPQAELH